ncbi:MAG TPA: DUF4386 domain-containing protein [Gemmatimonadaceae bacterium]|jgi:hypothetical protein
MTSLRKYSLAAGLFYLLTFVSIPTLALYSSVRGPRFVLSPGPDTPVILGVLLEMIVALAGIGTAVTLYPVVKRQGEARAVGFVASRTLEAATIYVGIVSLMSIVSLRQSGAGSAALATAQGLAEQYRWTFFFAQSFIPAVNGVLLGSLLYQARLVPRWLPVLGFIGAALLVAAWFGVLVGLIGAVSAPAAIATLPIAVWEFSLGIYLTFWGFKPSPITVGL